MLIEGVKLSDGTVIPIALDDDGKIILSAGDITIESATVDNVAIAAASLEVITDKLDELIALFPAALTTAGNLKVSIEEDNSVA